MRYTNLMELSVCALTIAWDISYKQAHSIFSLANKYSIPVISS